MKRSLRFEQCCVAIAAAPFLLGGAAGCDRSARQPASAGPAASGAARVESVADRPREQVALWRKQVERDPAGGTGWSNLGHALVALARSTSNESMYADAERAFRRSLELQPRGNPSARGGLARALMARHRFKDARAEAEAALAESPWEGWLLGLIGDAAVETGDYDTARQDYAEMLRTSDGPAARARAAQLAELCGDRPGALASYRRAGALYRADELEPRAWVLCQLGDLSLRAGQLQDARRHYEAALVLAPDYPVAQQRLAEYYEWAARPADAAPLLRQSIRGTRTPELLLRLSTVEAELGHTAGADSLRREAVAHMEHHYLAGDYGHVRTLARVLMDHPVQASDTARALELAQLDWTERGGVYAEWTLARALRLNHRPREALEHARRSLRLGTLEADFWLENATCLENLGRRNEARDARAAAHRLNPLAERRFQIGPAPVTHKRPV